MSGQQKGDKIVLRFGHSRSILPFIVRLGFFNDSAALFADNYHVHHKRLWRLAEINPFSSNIAFVLYHCQHEQYRIQILINEHEVAPPACHGGLCTWRDLKQLWQPIVDDCNFQKICEQNKPWTNSDGFLLNENQFHHA